MPVVAHLEPAELVVLVPRDVDAGAVDDVGLLLCPVVGGSFRIMFVLFGAFWVVGVISALAVNGGPKGFYTGTAIIVTDIWSMPGPDRN